MQTNLQHTVVAMPDNKKIEVFYYCSNGILKNGSKDLVDLIIQLHDCHSSIKISRSKIKDPNSLETIVQRTVINAKGHLCD